MAVEPKMTEEGVVAAIAEAVAANATIEIVGGGSKRGWGQPVRAERRLDMAALTGITLYEPAEVVLSAFAGTPLTEISAALAAQGQALAFEPPDLSGLWGEGPDRQTIGGIVATNLSGPRRLAGGAVRDHVLGLRAVNGRGESFKAGGRVVKNVTGYDLCKLLTGSFGTLAVLTEITVKVLPAAETEETVIVGGLDAGAAVRLMAEALGSPVNPSAAAWLPPGPAGRTLAGRVTGGASATCLRIEGIAPSVTVRRERHLRHIPEAAEIEILDAADSRAVWQQIGAVQPFHRQPDRAVWKASLRPSDSPDFLAAVSAVEGLEAFLDWGGGLVWLSLPLSSDAQHAILRSALPAGGHAALLRAPDAIRAAVPVFHPLPANVAVLEARLKARFDPQGILNPGRRE